jgi:cytochrome c-type biogenesis protein CcmH
MASFFFFALLLCLLACAFAVSALWQKSRALAVAIALLLTAAGGGLYWYKGAPVALEPKNVKPPETIAEAIAQLERLTAANPDNAADQLTLARAYMAAQRFSEASNAYARADDLLPPEAQVPVEHAEALLRASPDRRFPPEAVEMLKGALARDPDNQRALFFMGLHERMRGHHAEAVEHWEHLAKLIGADDAGALREQIAAARVDAGLPPLDEADALLQVNVEIDPTLARELGKGAVLYVFARDPSGAGPPVAVKRVQPGTWPVKVTLGDADGPMPTAKLSHLRNAVLAARLSRSGLATPTSGDIEADPVRVDVKAGTKANLVLTRTVP